jgi:hypothetical protein
MATAAELEIIINRLRRDIARSEQLIAQREQLLANPNLSEAQRRTGETVQARNREVLANQQRELAEAEQALSQAQTPGAQPTPPASAGQTVQNDAPQGPTKAPPATVSAPTLAQNNTADTNTDPPVRTTEQTQATSGYARGINIYTDEGTLSNFRRNPETGELYDATGLPSGVDLPTVPGTPTNDDAANNSTTTKQTELNAANNTSIKVTAQPNILDDFYSYTYAASVYLIKPEQYTRLITTTSTKLDGYNLLFQSGGAATNVGGVRSPQSASNATSGAPDNSSNVPDGGRSPFFPNDFYIDSVTIENQLIGKGTGAAHMASSIKFTVIEPQGITLLDRLYQAVANNEPKDSSGKVNYTTALFLMVIRFYGYDQDGNIQLPIKGGLQTESNTSDPKAAVEKFIPFQLTKVNWSIGSKTVSYDFEAAPVGQIQGGFISRGTIPYDVQLSDMTVGGLLGADVKYAPEAPAANNPGKSTTTDAKGRKNASTDPRVVGNSAASPQAPAKASAAPPKKVVTQGLMGAMNQFQQDLVTRGVYTIADEYSIEFVGVEGLASATDISGAKLQTANTKRDLKQSPGGKTATQPGGTDNLNPDKTQVDNVSRSFSITAGQQILQAIELSIRNSEYISKQALVTMNPDGSQEVNNTKTDPVKWFNITMSATRQPGGIDPKRNDYAYKIKYTVIPYALKNLDSQYFPYSKFSGVHKSYPFWFTGKNTAVRDYQETLNTMFTATISGSAPNNSLNAVANSKATSSMYDIVRYNYSPRSNQSSHGADGKTFEPNANAAEIIYNASDLAEAKVKIVGDPAWIQQGSLFKPITEGTISANTARTGFEPNGTISFDTGDVLFEMLWQRPEDYDLGTGLADPYARTAANDGGKRQPLQSRVYQATKVVSEFKNGAFEQTLNGSIFRFPIPGKSNTANPAAASGSGADGSDADGEGGRNTNQSSAETARLARQAANPRLPTGSTTAASETVAGRNAFANKTAALSAQGAYKPAQFAENAGGAAFGNPNITRQGITAGATLQPAGAPAAPTDGTGGSVSTDQSAAETARLARQAVGVGEAPPKLPGRPVTPGSLRALQIQATQERIARQNASSSDPTSATNAGNQQIVKNS